MTAVFAVLFVGLAVLSLIGGRRVWRNESARYTDEPPASWYRSLAAWRAMFRTFGFVTPAFLSLVAAGVVVAAIAPGRAWADGIAQGLIALGGLIFFVLGTTTYLVNWPKWAVPPHLRHQPGWVSERLGEPVKSTPPLQRHLPDS